MRQLFAWAALAALPFGSAFAQTQLPNTGFENWQNVGSSTEEPTNWNSNKTGGGFANLGPQTCYRESSGVYAGTYCLRVETKNYFGTPVNGTATTGKIQAPTTNPNDGYIQTLRSDANFYTAFIGRPDSLVGYYKYTQAGSDRAKIEITLHGDYDVRNPADAGSTPYIIGTASFLGTQGNVSSWTRFSVPFNYVNGSTPNYVLAIATASSATGSAASGSKLWVDELQVVYNPTIAVGSLTPSSPYYVSNSTGASVSVAYTVAGTYNAGNTFTLQLSDASGSFASPTNIGSVSATTSGNISGTIPAGTATGGGYRMRIVSSNPAVTSANNGNDLQVYLCTNAAAPSTAQTIEAAVNGTALSVTESTTASSREWKYTTVSGGTYSSFAPAQTGNNYTPNFAAAGTYFVVCTSTFPGGLAVSSNEVTVNVVDNAVTPSASQSILVSTNGTMLTVAETPSGTAREWKFATVSGGPYSSFGTAETGTTYTPNFGSPGNYFVVCQSTISGVTATSNEVQISVGSTTITTNSITGSPFEFSASAPAAAVSVPFTVSSAFVAGNVFTAQLSDASGSFASPTAIGTLTGTTSSTISASIPANTPDGSGYRIRVVGSNPAVNGSDNGTDLVVDQFSNGVSPSSIQNLTAGVAGAALAVSESQTAQSRAWRMATVSGGPYTAFTPAQTGVSYTPLFQQAGTYYVVCASTNQYGDEVLSNEVEFIVAGGTSLVTTTVTNSPYLVSPSANIQAVVDFTSNAVYNSGNVFNVELSDENGSFASATVVGSLTATAPASIIATIPNNTATGNSYRMRVVSSDPLLIGTDNGLDLSVVQFEVNASPLDTQHLLTNVAGLPITATATHPSTYEWKYRPTILIPYLSFSPAETAATYTPNFSQIGTQYLRCEAVNTWADTVVTADVILIITEGSAVNSLADASSVKVYWNRDVLVVDATHSDLAADARIELVNTAGQTLLSASLNGFNVNTIQTALPVGTYVVRLTDGKQQFTAQTVKTH